MYGAELMEALTRQFPDSQFFGVGGQRMRAAGCDIVADTRDLAVVGITEIVSHLPRIYRLFRKLIREADRRHPDIAVVIDSPAFNWRVARQMYRRGVPVVYYVCPQFWAWRQGRVRLLRKYIRKALVIFPFEEKFYRDRSVDATFVGHPLAHLPQPAVERAAYAREYALDASKPWITLMPGSRTKEVRMNLPAMLQAAALLGPEFEFLLPVAPTLDRSFLAAQAAGHPVTLVRDALPALWLSRAGIIASGTATVEAAMMNTPFVMVYRVGELTYRLGKPRIKIPFFAMVNLIAGRRIVAEFVQEDFTPENVARGLREIIPDGPERDAMLQGLAQVKADLKAGGGDAAVRPAERAAELIATILRPNPRHHAAPVKDSK